MTHEELRDKLYQSNKTSWRLALDAVVKLHKPTYVNSTNNRFMCVCMHYYPCYTIEAIERELV